MQDKRVNKEPGLLPETLETPLPSGWLSLHCYKGTKKNQICARPGFASGHAQIYPQHFNGVWGSSPSWSFIFLGWRLLLLNDSSKLLAIWEHFLPFLTSALWKRATRNWETVFGNRKKSECFSKYCPLFNCPGLNPGRGRQGYISASWTCGKMTAGDSAHLRPVLQHCSATTIVSSVREDLGGPLGTGVLKWKSIDTPCNWRHHPDLQQEGQGTQAFRFSRVHTTDESRERECLWET